MTAAMLGILASCISTVPKSINSSLVGFLSPTLSKSSPVRGGVYDFATCTLASWPAYIPHTSHFVCTPLPTGHACSPRYSNRQTLQKLLPIVFLPLWTHKRP